MVVSYVPVELRCIRLPRDAFTHEVKEHSMPGRDGAKTTCNQRLRQGPSILATEALDDARPAEDRLARCIRALFICAAALGATWH